MTYRVQVSRATGEQSELGPYPSYAVARQWADGQANLIHFQSGPARIESDAGIVHGHPNGKATMGAVETIAVWYWPAGALSARRLLATVHIIDDEADDTDRQHTMLRRETVLAGRA